MAGVALGDGGYWACNMEDPHLTFLIQPLTLFCRSFIELIVVGHLVVVVVVMVVLSLSHNTKLSNQIVLSFSLEHFPSGYKLLSLSVLLKYKL